MQTNRSHTTATTFQREGGLVYVETKDESDEQGLKNIYTLRDSNFLDGSFDTDGFAVPGTIVDLAWINAGGDPENRPSLLVERTLEVLNLAHPQPLSIPVRKFSQFALAVSKERISRGSALDSDELDRLIGGCLSELDLFPDELWRAGSEQRNRRRLKVNDLHSRLASSASSELDIDKTIDLCHRAKFVDESREEYGEDEQRKWQQLCVLYLQNPSRTVRAKLPYRIFEQIFAKDVRGLPLGDRVEEEIANREANRLDEFAGLDVKDGLNSRQREDAERFLEHQTNLLDVPELCNLLSRQTKKMVERLAHPVPERFANPLTAIAQVLAIFRDRNGDKIATQNVHLEIAVSLDTVSSSATIGLMSFLYGSALRSLIDCPVLAADGIGLEVDDRLLEAVPPPSLLLEEEVDEPASDEAAELPLQEIDWSPVPIEFFLVRTSDKEILDTESPYEWLPESWQKIALLWLFLSASDAPSINTRLLLPDGFELEDWISQVVARNVPLSSLIGATLPPEALHNVVVKRLLSARSSFLEATANQGLNRALLNDYIDEWGGLLSEAKDSLVPDGVRDLALDAFLQADFLGIPGGRSTVMLSTHPIRLRWLTHYLARSEEVASKALAGHLPLNSQNPDRYLTWIAGLSPHQHPPVACNYEGDIVFATRESGWLEEFSPVDASGDSLSAASIDRLSLQEICLQLTTYLEAHPHKRDGLSLLIVLSQDERLPAELISLLRKGIWSKLHVSVHVLAPQSMWPEISRCFQQLPGQSRLDATERLFPAVQLRLHVLRDHSSIAEDLGELQVDIAILPGLGHRDAIVLQNTEPPLDLQGSFDPNLDRPIHIYGGARGGSITVSMRPKMPDAAMRDWSTLVVRQNRHRPVSPQQPENSDFVEVQIGFQDTAQMFEEVHQRSHWVVTLEQHISREQIESLEPRPDILAVRQGVGSSGAYTLIVSSNSGRDFVIERLLRKLRRITTEGSGHVVGEDIAHALAERIYDETRRFAPRLVLQAMGISRVTEEILGLKMARLCAEAIFPSDLNDGIAVWISIDDHTDWLGGANATRADLARISLERTDAGIFADILVVEGKLRQAYDPHGLDQVRVTLKLIAEALPRETDDEPLIDSVFWRTQLLSAMESVDPGARRAFGSALDGLEEERYRLPLALRSAFRDGTFQVRSLRGLYSLCRHDKEDTLSVESEANGQIKTIRSYRNHICDMALGRFSPVFENEALDITSEEPPVGVSPTPSPVNDDDLPDTTRTTEDTEPAPRGQGKLSQEELHLRYQAILDRYGEFSVSVHKPDDPNDFFTEGPASVLYRVKPGHAVDPRKLSEKGDALKLTMALRTEQSIRFTIDAGFVTIDVPKSEEDRYFISAEDLWGRWSPPAASLAVPIGENHCGEIADIEFSSSKSPHLLVGGTTGSGKSEALNTILSGLTHYYTPKELRLLLIDPKGTEFQSFASLGHLEGDIGWLEEDAIRILDKGVEEMQSRYALFRQSGKRHLAEYNEGVSETERIPWWLIVLDEYADLTSDPTAKRSIEQQLRRLTQKARAAGIHIIVATQKPSVEVINTNLRSNLPAQLALQVKSATESRVIMDEAGAETLNGKGDAFLRAAGFLTRIQCAISSSSS